ncbi:hypothetical protein [Streptomyces sp. NPDC088183]|uniref:hypothetical protein n=1 Tax=Streptomyces sp. NPDC088183 TaxID=3160992 RepID=UPI003439CC4F
MDLNIDSAPASQSDAVLREITALYRLHVEDPDIASGPRGREYLLRQAAAVMIMAATPVDEPTPAMLELRAEGHLYTVEAAHALLQYDRLHNTSRGAVPARDEQWDTDTAGYVRQEYRVWRAKKQ